MTPDEEFERLKDERGPHYWDHQFIVQFFASADAKQTGLILTHSETGQAVNLLRNNPVSRNEMLADAHSALHIDYGSPS